MPKNEKPADDVKVDETKVDEAPALTARTADSDDVNRSWTVQSDSDYVVPEAVPGQTFVKAQLPDAEAQKAAGIDPEAFAEALVIVEADKDAEDKSLVPDDVLSGRV